ncbi:uncharacterized protein LOC107045063 [Diachasma alloeum]|uniref:uncharacterized protein LOC107045063 n=1 Tax=Diachasma alloeum TaxID=454923 RepID=UPI000738457F|nr:uncharacterized protein LOC107045063 [Diachasma alloeum]
MPDFTDVKMRKCTVTYVIYPRHSDDSEDENSARLQMPEMKQRVMLKSSVMLDVSYASRNDVGKYPAHSPLARTLSSLGNLGSSISKSRIFQNHHSLSGEFSSTSRVTNLQHLRCRNVVLATIPFSSSNEISKEYSKLTTIRENAGLLNDTLETLSLPVTSVHSSDSGMADSCHMTSSELNYRCYARGRNKYAERAQMSHSESENDENKFEHQCICTSPFDSTPRQSHQSAESIQNMFKIYTSMSGTIDPKFKRIDEGYMRFLSNNDEDGRENLELLQIDENINRGGDENKDDEDCSKENTLPAKNEMDKTRFTTPILLEHQNISNKHGKIHRYPNAISVGQVHTAPVYTSGLYAHWWLKKTIPIDEGTKQGKLPWHGCYSFLVFKFRTTHFLKYSSSSIECDLFMIAYPTDIALLIEN